MPTKNRSLQNQEKINNKDAEGFLCLSGDTLWKWRAFDAEVRAAQAELDSVNHRIQVEISKNQELASLLQKKAALSGSLSTAMKDLLGVQQEIEKNMGISLKDHAFDDKTGRLYNLASEDPVVHQQKTKSVKKKPSKVK